MAIRIVKQDGSGDFTTITAALAVSGPGDIIEIQDSSIYVENIAISIISLTIQVGAGCSPTLQSAAGNAVSVGAGRNSFQLLGVDATHRLTIECLGAGNAIYFAGDLTDIYIDEINVVGINSTGIFGDGAITGNLEVTNSSFVVQTGFYSVLGFSDLAFRYSTLECQKAYHGDACGMTFEHCIVRAEDIFMSVGATMAVTEIGFINCLLMCYKTSGVEPFLHLYQTPSSGFILANTTIVGRTLYAQSSVPGVGSDAADNSGTLDVNVIIYGFAVGVTSTSVWNTASLGPYVIGSIGTTYGGLAVAGIGSLSADPVFVAPASEDFHLQSTSPCRGIGTDLNAFGVTDDLDEVARPVGLTDVGCYVYVAPVFHEVVDADHVAETMVRVNFSVAMSPAGLMSGWTITGDGSPTVSLVTISLSGLFVTLTLDQEPTLGEVYTVTAPLTAESLTGDLIDPAHRDATYTGLSFAYTLTAVTPTTVLATFTNVPLPSVGDISNWSFSNVTSYPISLTLVSVEYPYLGNPLEVLITVKGMTTIWYSGQLTLPVPRAFLGRPRAPIPMFFGLGGAARDILWTRKGPLVKDWGDDTPATVKDVHVYVGALQAEVTVAEVNPFTGRIRLDIPVPLLVPGDPDALVTVDYRWIASPIMEMSGLNTDGLVLNKWDRNGRLPRGSRFPMGVVLGPKHRPDPMQIGWRFIGFERAASAMLNAPTTLALNQGTATDSVPFFYRQQPSILGTWEATQTPTAASWVLFGTDSGSLTTSGEYVGTYTLEDANSGIYDANSGDSKLYCARYAYPVDVFDMNPEGASIQVTTRFEILDAQPDGIFTGIAFGAGGSSLKIAGAVKVNGLEHVGILGNILRPDLVDSWVLGPQVVGTIILPDLPDGFVNRIQMPTAEIPSNLTVGGKFQILTGSQAGVYTIQSVVANANRITTATVTPVFPANPRLSGNRNPSVLFETPWSGSPSTYRLYLDTKTSTLSLWMSGSVVMVANRPIITGAIPIEFPDAADSPIFGTLKDGIWWGSISFKATNQSRWSFVRYNVTPYTPTFRSASLDPEAFDPSVTAPELQEGFFRSSKFGNSWGEGNKFVSQSSFGTETITGFETLPGNFAQNIESFLTKVSNFEVSTELSQDFGSAAATPIVLVNDGTKVTMLGTLQYVEKVTAGYTYRRLIDLPNTAMTGFTLPTDQGFWNVYDNLAPVYPAVTDTQLAGQAFQHTVDIDDPEILNQAVSAGRSVSFWMRTSAGIATPDGMSSIYAGADVSSTAHIRLRFRDSDDAGSRSVVVTTLTGTILQEKLFDWKDGQYHFYQIVSNGTGSIRVSADYTLVGPIIQVAECPGHLGDFLHDREEFGTLANPAWKAIVDFIPVSYLATAIVEPVGSSVQITQADDQPLLYSSTVMNTLEPVLDDGGRVMNANLAIQSATFVADLTPVIFASDVAWTTGHIQIRFGGVTTPYVALADINGNVIQTYPFDWNDGEYHDYRVTISSVGTVTLFLDDAVQIPTLTVAQFPGRLSSTPTAEDLCYFGALSGTGWESTVLWHSVFVTHLPASDMKRTVGVFKGDSLSTLWDIDDWELPRSDSSTALNSAQVGPVVEEVDWTTTKEFRLVRTPEWGATVYIPSLGTPPWHTGVRQGWVNPKSEPSAGWINVEYERITPTFSTDRYGSFQFGGYAVSQQRWEWFRTRLYLPQDPNYIAPPQMVLNRCNVITSGDLKKDTSLEIVAIQSIDNRRVTLKPTHIYAQSVYKIIDGTNIITRESWDFDSYSQLVTLKDPIYQPTGGTATFSSDHANLTVVYLPGRPVTETYLANQALSESVTLLNEGTPPVPKQHEAGNLIETLTSHGATQLDLSTASTFVMDVVKVTDQTAVPPATRFIYTPTDWTFDQETQILTLNAGLAFTVPATPLTVEFTPRKTYLGIKQSAVVTDATHVDLTQMGNLVLSVIKIEDGSQVFNATDLSFNSGTQIVTLNAGKSFSVLALPPYNQPVTVWYNPVSANLGSGDPTAVHVDPSGTYYRDLKFITVDNEGQTGLIAPIGENTLGVGQTGFIAGEGGDPIYSLTGAGPSLGGAGPCEGLFDTLTTVGSPVGSSVFSFTGSKFSEVIHPVSVARVTFDLRLPDGTVINQWVRIFSWPTMQKVSGVLLFASGGTAATGGLLNDATLY